MMKDTKAHCTLCGVRLPRKRRKLREEGQAMCKHCNGLVAGSMLVMLQEEVAKA